LLVLDVGCGRRPRGNINVNITKEYPHSPTRFEKEDKVIHFWKLKEIPNFILASGDFLPFRNRVFDRVVSVDVFEHLQRPFQTLKEIVRVCKGQVEIRAAHRFFAKIKAKERGHFSFLNMSWFIRAFRILDINDYDITPVNRYLPHPILPLFAIPETLKIHFWVKPES